MRKPGRFGWALLTMLLGLAPAQALAKDVCIRQTGSGRYIFRAVKTLRPGRVVPLTGAFVFPGFDFAFPVDGTAVMRADGTVNIGVMVHSMNASPSPTSSSFLVVLEANADFTGTGTVDLDGDFSPNDTVAWTSVSCSSVAIP